MKKMPAISIALLSFVLGGCSTIFTGNNQQVEVRTQNDEVGTKLDHVAKFQVLGDAYRVKYDNLSAGEIITVHRKGKPIVVRVKESDCILPSEEHFDAGVHPAVLLDVLATSLLSTSIDSSTGAAWRYDKRLYVTPRIKDTPECRRWLENEVKTMSETVESKPSEIDSTVNLGGYAYREDAERHPVGYADQIEKKISPGKNNEGEEAQTSHATIKNK